MAPARIMAKAEFYRGFVFEQGISTLLTIEGNPIRLKPATGGRVSARLPGGETITKKTATDLAKLYIRRSGAAKRRNRHRAEHVEILLSGCKEWNEWRQRERHIQPMLAGYDFTKYRKTLKLAKYDFSYANLTGAVLKGFHLEGANFHQAILANANLSRAHLEGANFCRTDLYRTNLSGASLRGANLQGVQLAKTKLRGARLERCKVYGLSAWDLDLKGARDQELVIRYEDPIARPRDVEQTLKVSGLDLASFMYLTVDNRNLQRIIQAANRQCVLLLGNFTRDMRVLRALERKLKSWGHIPITFDFGRPEARDLSETVLLLAGLSRFVVAEITHPRSVPLELQLISSNYAVPIVPLLRGKKKAFAMIEGLKKFRGMQPTIRYHSVDDLGRKLSAFMARLARDEKYRQRVAKATRSVARSRKAAVRSTVRRPA
jgi:hypothetical protein